MTRFAYALCIALGFSTALIAFPQTRQNDENQAIIELSRDQSSEPVVITSIKVDGHEVGTNAFSVPPGKQWLKSLSVTITNKTGQVINGVDLQLFFPETGSGSRDHPFVGYQSQWGSTPVSRINAPILGQHMPGPLGIAPNGKAEFDLGKHFDEYASLLSSRMELTTPHQARLTVLLVDFANNVEWSGNVFFSVSPSGVHTPINSKEMF